MLPVLSERVIRTIMEKFKKADSLNLSGNGIREIEDMSLMNYLVKLNLSSNLLTKVDGLSGLTRLIELNLSQNKINDISGLSALHQLEILDVSSNSLQSIESLRCLEGLNSLKKILVANNPFTVSNPKYQRDLLQILPQIREIDATPTSTIAEPIQPHGSPAEKGRFDSQNERYLRHYIKGLENQIAGYQKMFTDKELLISGLLKEGNEENECAYAVLTLWREQCHREMMKRILAEENANTIERQAAIERRNALEKIQQLSASLVTLSDELASAESVIDDQRRENDDLRGQLEAERECRVGFQERNESLQTSFDRLRTFLEYYREKMDREMITLDVVESKIEHRMAALEGRLEGANERIGVLGTLLQMKEVELRNSQAVLAAERRLFWLREERKKEMAPSSDESEPLGDAECVFLSDVKIDPEVESLLRTMFRHLDPTDSGTVDMTILQTCLQTARAHGLLPTPVRSNDNPCSCESTLWDRFLQILDDMIIKKKDFVPHDMTITWGELLLLFIPESVGHPDNFSVNGNSRMKYPQMIAAEKLDDNILCICRCDHCLQCEWKKNLDGDEDLKTSPIIPRKHDLGVYSRLPLTHHEYSSLHQAKLLGDCQWAMIPLQISIPSPSCSPNGRDFSTAREMSTWLLNIAKSGCCSCLGEKHECCDIRRVSCEAVRLAAERSYLLQRLQAMNRSLERRAESIRGFFESELRRGETRLQKANLQLSECQSAIISMEERLRLQDTRHRTEKKNFEDRLNHLELENEALQRKLDDVVNDRDSDLTKHLDETSQRCMRLESELKVLRKELSKNEVTNKTLQRDLLRLQNANSGALDSMSRLRSEKEELEKLWHGSQEEIHAMRRKLEETNHLLETATRKVEEYQKFTTPTSPPPSPPSHPSLLETPLSPSGYLSNLPPPNRPPAPTNNALDTLSKKIRLMSDQLNRLEPSSGNGT